MHESSVRFLLLVVLAVALPVAASAQVLYAFDFLYDADGSAATGGPVTVVQGAEMPHDEPGIEYIVRAVVSFDAPAATTGSESASTANRTAPLMLPLEVVSVGVFTWDGVDFLGMLSPSVYAVGVGNGTDGGNVVEWQVPLSEVGGTPQGGAGGLFHVSQPGLENDYTASFNFPSQLLLEIPTLGVWGLLLLALLLATSAAVLLRRRRAAALALATTALLAAGAAWAAGGFTMDGMVGDWSGRNPVVTDPSGDSSADDPAEDILACWATAEEGYLTLRCDVVGSPPPL